MIIFPSISDPYVYLKSLNDPNLVYKRKTYHTANDLLDVGKILNLNSEKITLSLDFLKQRAAEERANEIAFFSSKLQQLGKYDGERIKNLIDTLVQDPSTINYVSFIRELNEVMKGIDATQKRIQSFLNSKSGNKKLNKSALASADQLLSSLKATRSKVASNLDELIRAITLKFFEEECGKQVERLFMEKQANTSVKDLTAMAIYLQQSILSFLVDNEQILNYNPNIGVDDFDAKLKEVYPAFRDAFIQTNAAQTLVNGGHQLNVALKEVSSFFHIEMENKAVKKQGRKKSLAEEQVQQLFSHTGVDSKKIRMLLRRVKIKTKFQAQEFGNYKELGSLIGEQIVSGVNVGGKGGATDTIFAGRFYTTADTKGINENILFEDEQRIIENLKAMLSSDNNTETNNVAFEEALKKLNNLYNSVSEIQNSFLIHESTKYYQTLEQGSWFRDKGFHGRNMNIFTYINDISRLGDSIGVDTKWLNFAALNLNESAVGERLKSPLEQYFTIFIGLVMFDDFEVAAKGFAESLPNSKVSNIHLYRLQDLYFPTSYFLEQTYYRMTNIFDEISSNNGFSVKITTSPINDSLVGNSEIENWLAVRDYAYKNTKIETLFAANFLDLVSQMGL